MSDVSLQGPFFRDRAAIMSRMTEGIRKDVAEVGYNLVERNLNESIRVNTGGYTGRIHTKNMSDSNLITDGNAVMGPWLEGTGSRNRTTRFKGYFSFRRATQELDQKTEAIAEAAARPYLAELNG